MEDEIYEAYRRYQHTLRTLEEESDQNQMELKETEDFQKTNGMFLSEMREVFDSLFQSKDKEWLQKMDLCEAEFEDCRRQNIKDLDDRQEKLLRIRQSFYNMEEEAYDTYQKEKSEIEARYEEKGDPAYGN